MRRKLYIFSVIILLFACYAASRDENSFVIAIKDVFIIPVVGQDIPEGTIIIKDGLIDEIGHDIPIPAGAKLYSAKGLRAYPGMIDSSCYLGLHEIGSLRATIDNRETGDINPQVKAVEALRPDSMHIPISRSNGITTALVVPSGGLVAGQSGLIRLLGWTPDEMVIKESIAMHIELPGMGRSGRRSAIQEHQPASKKITELKELLHKARMYQKQKNAAKKDVTLSLPPFDEKLEFMLPVINGDLPVVISVHSEHDILDAIQFVKDENVKSIFYGVSQGWKVADKIKEAGIPVIFGSLYAMPPKWEDGYDSLYRNPTILHKAGVLFAFSSQSATLAKDLPYHAAKAAAFGLDKREALKGVTIYPARIFGIDDKMGSLEKGKIANIVLADGDILEMRTSIKHVFIDGKEADLSSVYTELLEKYKKRND
jgi:imidazolonepropionase-like amidohydrolase